MSGFEVKFSGDFDGFERKAKQLAQQKLVEMAGQYQALLDGLSRTHAGKPAAEIKPLLRSRWQRVGGDITDPELSTYAKQIAAGGRIVVQAGDLK